jgi:hypothetical protein
MLIIGSYASRFWKFILIHIWTKKCDSISIQYFIHFLIDWIFFHPKSPMFIVFYQKIVHLQSTYFNLNIRIKNDNPIINYKVLGLWGDGKWN